MKFSTTPFNILKNTFKNKTLVDVSCSIDDIEVPIKECGVELDGNQEVLTIDFWDEECKGHPTSSHCKVYDD